MPIYTRIINQIEVRWSFFKVVNLAKTKELKYKQFRMNLNYWSRFATKNDEIKYKSIIRGQEESLENWDGQFVLWNIRPLNSGNISVQWTWTFNHQNKPNRWSSSFRNLIIWNTSNDCTRSRQHTSKHIVQVPKSDLWSIISNLFKHTCTESNS